MRQENHRRQRERIGSDEDGVLSRFTVRAVRRRGFKMSFAFKTYLGAWLDLCISRRIVARVHKFRCTLSMWSGSHVQLRPGVGPCCGVGVDRGAYVLVSESMPLSVRLYSFRNLKTCTYSPKELISPTEFYKSYMM